MNIFKHIWPWSELERLRRQCHDHWEFGEACLFYLDFIEPQNKHLRFNDQLFLMAPKDTQVIRREEPGARHSVGCLESGATIYFDEAGIFTDADLKKFTAADYGFPGSADTTIFTTVDHDYHAHSNEDDKSLWRSLRRGFK